MLEFGKQICVSLVVAGALYGGIRADLANALQQGIRANERIDAILMENLKNG